MWITEVLDYTSLRSLPAIHSLQLALQSARLPLFCYCSVSRRVMVEDVRAEVLCSTPMRVQSKQLQNRGVHVTERWMKDLYECAT